MSKALQRSAFVITATIATLGAILTSSTIVLANAESIDTPMGSVIQSDKNYSANLIVIGKNGSEFFKIQRSNVTIAQELKNRGYNPSDFKDENGNKIEPGLRIGNGEDFTVYATSVTGKSESVNIKAPENETQSSELYKGQRVVKSAGIDGRAVKTTVANTASPDINDIDQVYLTITSTPVASEILVGSKDCNYEYICELLESNEGYLEFDSYTHPLGGQQGWTTYSGSRGHDNGAVDIPMASGTPIYAIAPGTVVESGWLGDGGNMVVIRHADGNLSGYAHMVETPPVEKGDTVSAGQKIGEVGSTGNSTGPHLHFEIFKERVWGASIPAYEYMKLHGVDLGPCVGGPCQLSKKD